MRGPDPACGYEERRWFDDTISVARGPGGTTASSDTTPRFCVHYERRKLYAAVVCCCPSHASNQALAPATSASISTTVRYIKAGQDLKAGIGFTQRLGTFVGCSSGRDSRLHKLQPGLVGAPSRFPGLAPIDGATLFPFGGKSWRFAPSFASALAPFLGRWPTG